MINTKVFFNITIKIIYVDKDDKGDPWGTLCLIVEVFESKPRIETNCFLSER